MAKNKTPIDMVAEVLTFNFDEMLPQYDKIDNMQTEFRNRQNKFGLARRKDRQARQDAMQLQMEMRKLEIMTNQKTRKIELMANMHVKMQELELSRAESKIRTQAAESAKKASDLAAKETEARLKEFNETKEHRATMREHEVNKAEMDAKIDQQRLFEIRDLRKNHAMGRKKMIFDMVQGGIKTLRDGFVSFAQVAESQQNISESQTREKIKQIELQVATNMTAQTEKVTAQVDALNLAPDQRALVLREFEENGTPIAQGVKNVARKNAGLMTNEESHRVVGDILEGSRTQTTSLDNDKTVVSGPYDPEVATAQFRLYEPLLTQQAKVGFMQALEVGRTDDPRQAGAVGAAEASQNPLAATPMPGPSPTPQPGLGLLQRGAEPADPRYQDMMFPGINALGSGLLDILESFPGDAKLNEQL